MEQGDTNYGSQEQTLNVLDYWRAIYTRWWLITFLCLVSMLVSLVHTRRQPKLYTAAVTILSPKEVGVGLDVGGLTVSVEGLGSPGAGGRDRPVGFFSFAPKVASRSTYFALLKSRTAREQVVEHFRPTWGPLVGAHSIDVSDTKEGTIVLRATSPDPNLSALLANYYFEAIQHWLAHMTQDTIRVTRGFYVAQLEKASKDYKEAQDSLIKFQEKHRIVLSPAAERKIAAEAMGAASIAQLDVQLALMRMSLTDQHPDVVALKRQIYEAKKLLSHSLYGEPQDLPPERAGAPARKEYFVATAKTLPVQFMLVDLFRVFKFREALYNTVASNVEISDYLEKFPMVAPIEWVDKALPPSQPSSPDIRYNVSAAGVGSLALGILLALFLEYLARLKAWQRLTRTQARAAAYPGRLAAELSDGPIHALDDAPPERPSPASGGARRVAEAGEDRLPESQERSQRDRIRG